MGKIKYLLLIIALCLITYGCGKKVENIPKDDARKGSTPLLYEVTKEGSNTKLYLMGSIHAADENVLPFSSEINNAFNKSDALAVEFDLLAFESDIEAQMSLVFCFLYDDGKTIKDDLGDELYNVAVAVLKDEGLYSPLYDMYKPAMWQSLLESAAIEKAGLDSESGVDKYFLNEAKNSSKEILELESAEMQFDLLFSFSDEMQKVLIKDAVENIDDSVANLKELYSLYLKGDKEKIEELLFKEDEELSDEMAKEYNNALITERNKGMYTKLDSYFKEEKTVFCVVGLAHIIGEEGLVNLFEQSGYKVVQK